MVEIKTLIGIDEVGRGPLAGPVTLGAVSFDINNSGKYLKGIRDSKKLSSKKREDWNKKINLLKEKGHLNSAISSIGQKIIDRKGVACAVRLGIKRCLDKISADPATSLVLLDGSLKAPKSFPFQKTIIKGDDKVYVIAAASVIAKVHRDKKMIRLAKKYPEYGFEVHKGYGTELHFRNIRKFGLSEIHRRSYCSFLQNNVK